MTGYVIFLQIISNNFFYIVEEKILKKQWKSFTAHYYTGMCLIFCKINGKISEIILHSSLNELQTLDKWPNKTRREEILNQVHRYRIDRTKLNGSRLNVVESL